MTALPTLPLLDITPNLNPEIPRRYVFCTECCQSMLLTVRGIMPEHRRPNVDETCPHQGDRFGRNVVETLDAIVDLGRAHGFYVTGTDLRDLDGQYSLDLDGHGELLEVTFRQDPVTGYFRYESTFQHDNHGGGDRWRHLLRTRRWVERRPLELHYRYQPEFD